MNFTDNHMNTSVLITGIQQDISREQLIKEFEIFGPITKVYIDSQGRFAKVYFPETKFCFEAAGGLRRNRYNWTIQYKEIREEAYALESQFLDNKDDHSEHFSKQNKQNTMEDNPYCDEEFTENYGYCNIHGIPITVLQADSGDIYVNLKDIKKTGFNIFAADNFDMTLSDRRQINREFELYLLSEAKKYILNNRAYTIDENTILKTIENCKAKLLGEYTSPEGQRTKERVVHLNDNSFSISTSNTNNEYQFTQPQNNALGSRGQTADSRFRKQKINNKFQQESKNHSQENRNQRQGNRDQYQGSRDQSQGNRDQHKGSRDQSQGNRDQSQGNRGRNYSANQRQSFGPSDNKNSDRNLTQEKKQDGLLGSYSDYWSLDKPNTNNNHKNSQNNQNQHPFADLSQSFQSRPPKNLPSNFQANNKPAQSSFKQESRGFNNNNFENNTKSKQQKTGSSGSSTSSENRKLDLGDTLTRVSLEIYNEYNVKVCYVDPNKENICWVHEENSASQLEELMLQIFEMEPTLKTIENPKRGDLVISLFEDIWCRAILINNNTVQYLDYGNRGNIESCKVLPTSLQQIPALAVRVVVNSKRKLVDEMTLRIKILKKYDDDTYQVDDLGNYSASTDIQNSNIERKSEDNLQDIQPVCPPEREKSVSPVEVPKAKSQIDDNLETKENKRPPSVTDKVKDGHYYLDIPKPLNTLKTGDTVAIVDFDKKKLFLKTKECMEQAKKIRTHIKELDKSELIMNNVKEGQLVLCSKDGMESLCRAVVVEKQSGSVASIKYVDYPGTDILSIKSLRNVDEFLAKEPAALYIFDDVEILNGLGVSSKNYLTEIVGRKEKLVIQISGTKIDFKLQNGELLSETLQAMNKPKDIASSSNKPVDPEPKKKTEESSKSNDKTERVKYDDMEWIQVAPGTHEFTCYSLTSATDLMLVLHRDDVIQHMELLSDLQVEDQQPFKPELGDMCLVNNAEDNLWERAVVYSAEGDDFIVFTVDFGTEITVKSDQLRSFPAYLKKVPIIGMQCAINGVEDTPQVNKIVKEMILEMADLTVKIIEYNEESMKYKIEHEQVKEKLKKEGLY